MDRVSNWISYIEKHSRVFKLASAPAILMMIGSVYLLVYYTGGIKYVYSHSMYIPIVLSAFIFGAKGGLVTGILAGITLGPFMPIDVTTGETQELINWLYRMLFFITIGLITGAMVRLLQSYIEHVEWLAHHDYNTKLPNRLSLIKALDDSGVEKQSQCRSLLVLSIENLQKIIAGFGLESADRLVQNVVSHLTQYFPDNVRFFHHHPEHIAILINTPRQQEIRSLIRDILEQMRSPYEYRNVPLHLDVRIGCTNMSAREESPTSVITRAEFALNEAREKLHDYNFYDEAMENTSTETLSLLGSLKKAIEEGQLELHYQPKIDFNTCRISGTEALLRWNHPDKGMIPPGKFIPQAENSRLIQPLSEWVLDRALEQQALWRDMGLQLQMAVNISTRNLLQSDFVDILARLMARHGTDPDSLELEITETSLMYNPDEALAMLNRLADVGVAISIDDFGTGYSSLQYLNTLSASIIKIDQTFIRDMTVTAGAHHIVKSSIALGHSLGYKVISEGIETPESYGQLHEMHCDVGQGYYIARPMPAVQLTDWILEREAAN